MTDWIKHNGGPQPVADDVWVSLHEPDGYVIAWLSQAVSWQKQTSYRILNQHLIDAKQAEIHQLRDDLETWQSVFPHIMPDRLKSDKQLAEEDVRAAMGVGEICEETEAGVRVVTHCLFPSFEPVSVFVSKFGDGYRVTDGGAALRCAWRHGRDEALSRRTLSREADRYHLKVSNYALMADVPSIDWLRAAILAVANASASVAHTAIIDAARLEGIRLGLEAANKAVEALVGAGDLHIEEESALEEASIAICTLNFEAIAREAQDLGNDTSAGTTA